jgi:hypothetical protein
MWEAIKNIPEPARMMTASRPHSLPQRRFPRPYVTIRTPPPNRKLGSNAVNKEMLKMCMNTP